MKVRVRVAGVVEREGRILLVQHRALPYFVLPGGGLKEGETLEQGLERELAEETGLLVVPERLLFVGHFLRPERPVLDLVFLARLAGGRERQEQGSQITALRWAVLAEARTLDLRPHPIFEGVLAGLQSGFPPGASYVGSYAPDDPPEER
jgi:ADP-ribose pyrophosphatase YjhB (NUDIX family)